MLIDFCVLWVGGVPTDTERRWRLRCARSVQVMVEEKLLVVMDKEGALKKLEVGGGIRVVVNDPDHSRLLIRTSGAPKSNAIKCRVCVCAVRCGGEALLSIRC